MRSKSSVMAEKFIVCLKAIEKDTLVNLGLQRCLVKTQIIMIKGGYISMIL